jgi:hypothetical protein
MIFVLVGVGAVRVVVVVHGFGAKANDGDVAVVLKEFVLMAKEGAEKFRILMF